VAKRKPYFDPFRERGNDGSLDSSKNTWRHAYYLSRSVLIEFGIFFEDSSSQLRVESQTLFPHHIHVQKPRLNLRLGRQKLLASSTSFYPVARGIFCRRVSEKEVIFPDRLNIATLCACLQASDDVNDTVMLDLFVVDVVGHSVFSVALHLFEVVVLFQH
jgi:hypothetical protein